MPASATAPVTASLSIRASVYSMLRTIGEMYQPTIAMSCSCGSVAISVQPVHEFGVGVVGLAGGHPSDEVAHRVVGVALGGRGPHDRDAQADADLVGRRVDHALVA